MTKMKIVSFNCNGIRSVLSKEKDGTKHKQFIENNVLAKVLDELKPDVLCLQEIRCNDKLDISSILRLDERQYSIVGMNCALNKKGYSGTLTMVKHSLVPRIQRIQRDFESNEDENINQEGRVITVEFPECIIINTYVPNSKPDLSRLQWRVDVWEPAMRNHIKSLQKRSKKTIVLCGDLNVAPNDIDVHNPKTAKNQHGFTQEEKDAFSLLLKECDLVDAFRLLYPTQPNAYTWWSNFHKSREKNKGWQIDKILISAKMSQSIQQVQIHTDYYGSDHAVISMDFTA
jgi:exodeoxyribonuclease-3